MQTYQAKPLTGIAGVQHLLRLALESDGRPYTRVAHEAGLSHSVLNHILSGKRTDSSLDNPSFIHSLRRIARTLGKPTTFFDSVLHAPRTPFGAVVQYERLVRGWSQQDLTDATGGAVERTTISRLEAEQGFIASERACREVALALSMPWTRSGPPELACSACGVVDKDLHAWCRACGARLPLTEEVPLT